MKVTGDFSSHYGLQSDGISPQIPPPEIDDRSNSSLSGFPPHCEAHQTLEDIDSQLKEDKEGLYK